MAPRKFKPFVPGATYLGQSFSPSGQPAVNSVDSLFQNSVQPRSSGPGAVSGTSTPLSSASSTVSLSALTTALDKISRSPITEEFEAIRDAKSMADVRPAVQAGADKLFEAGANSIAEWHFNEGIAALLKAKSGGVQLKEGALAFVTAVSRKFGPESAAQIYLIPILLTCYDLLVDKDANVKRLASSTIAALQESFTPEVSASSLLSAVLEYLDTGAKWQAKQAALKTFEHILATVPEDYLDGTFIDAIPVLTSVLHDFKPEVAKEGDKAIKALIAKLDNQDVTPRVDVIVQALKDPKNVQDTIKTLSAVTFVTEVTESALSVLVPILSRALSVFSTQDSLRQTVTVTENLTRLVHNTHEVKPFIPELKPGVEKVVQTASLPEVRELASKALAVLQAAETETAEISKLTTENALQEIEALETVPDALVDDGAKLLRLCVNTREFGKLEVYLETFFGLDKAAAEGKVKYFKGLFSDSRVPEVEEEGIEIVNTQFSLAYGGRMLLNKTNLRLYKGRRYGLLGRNGAGKSTLMRAIAEGKLEGFPDKSQLRTSFVEHKLQASEADYDLVKFISLDEDIDANEKEVAAALAEVGFDEERRSQKVGALSGGWKMKLELARAMLMKADILLLDEPTNHLDVKNVAWLVEYLNTHTEITSLIVSHDSGFLDNVCTDVIHYESKKLVYYKGNLSEFVKVRPEAKSYYTLSDSMVKMAFPAPGILTGVRSNTRAIARMSDVSFAYPGAPKPSLSHVSCSVSLSSRIAIVGPNGAGKSTLIKLLTGELGPTSGTVEKHPNLRIGYIAQHAFQHVEQHKEKTPNQYLQWRYRNGDDREVHLKQTRQLSAEEEERISTPIDIGDGGRARTLQAIIGRQKLKKSFQYEISWVGFLPKHNTFMSREELIERGFGKLVQAFDDHEASREGLGYRQLQPPVIRKHFEDIGLDGDIADHTPMGSLSGGQLVKVVIAGATWNNPHLLVLDEPTNYLDRDSLGGLAVAIRDWSGGVLLISHNDEFVGALATEQWAVNDGKMVSRVRSSVHDERFEDAVPASPAPASETPSVESSAAPSAAGSAAASAANSDTESPLNIKIRKKKKKLTRNELKEREVRRRLRYLEWLNSPKGTPKPEDTDSE